jgi:hypothetical protein
MGGDEASFVAGFRQHGVAQREVRERGEHAAVANAARVGVLLLDGEADRHRLSLALLVQRSDQRVERAQPFNEVKTFRNDGHRARF